MSGTATFKLFTTIEDMTAVPQPYPGTITWTVTGIDEASCRYLDIAATGGASPAIDVGEIDTVTGFWLYVVVGGTTDATGIQVDLETATWTTAHDVLRQGEARFYRPSVATLSLKNLSSSVATVSYMVFGDNE